MAGFTIITNNPKVFVKFADKADFINASAADVLTTVRDAVHKGAALISHPQSGSLRPGTSPYKSIIISDIKPHLDFMSLRLIEEAMVISRKNGTIKYKAYQDDILADFQVVDLDLIESALSSMPPEYI